MGLTLKPFYWRVGANSEFIFEELGILQQIVALWEMMC